MTQLPPKPPSAKEYMKMFRERAKTSHIYSKHQMIGLSLAEILEDSKHKALYIKLAKKHDNEKLIRVAKGVAEKKGVKNKGAYFMKVFYDSNDREQKK
ncbi:hypothetical protein A3A20_01675 [Candidatus Wolfebacteria bacterium RIFCSPLOWO2_01_FULL_45_19]|uniref:Uncharacterized protein n=1 Tax=Candidatus Wolfebacteria bacterium RIFCSPLOWO2_01_FULL_45_19 TaxID=1802557 RepID=A0A1F8DUG4_9BACT|nr:MAG: hypothetical protein UX23_C0002G0040 [Parcubacteria group bacterium GW2011_GWB1_45_9]OGM91629.1 MAG: hypothetical protein A3A20_01675 [Candidatus Wolfebacteria bacterium RIFCSPLOWO2_01_FULL_45_19]